MENAEKIELIKNKIIAFFSKKGVEEVNLSNKVMMLNGSLNFNNILKFEMVGLEYPLPQTSLFNLEFDYVKSQFGVFTFVNVYEYDSNGNPIEKIVCEFILKGEDKIMNAVNSELANALGFSIPVTLNYEDILRKYSVVKMDDTIKYRLNTNIGNVVTIKNFPTNEHSNWFIKSLNNEYQVRETILNGFSSIMYYQLIDDREALRYNFQTFNNSNVRETMLNNFDSPSFYDELNNVCQLDLEERFLGRIDITQLLKFN
jgi:hypothetical protein